MTVLFDLVCGISLLLASVFIAMEGLKEMDSEVAQAILVAEEQRVDFGEISSGAALEAKFVVENISDGSVEITRLLPACSCSNAKASDLNLSPGEQTEISVEWDTSGLRGYSETYVIVVYKRKEETTLKSIPLYLTGTPGD